MFTKICTKCSNEYDVSFFNKNIRKKDGYDIYCKNCTREMSKESYLKNIDKVKKRHKEYSKTEKSKEYQKKWRQENNDKCNEYTKKYRGNDNNKQKLKEARKKQRERERFLERERYSSNPELYREKNRKKRFNNIENTRLRERLASHKRRELKRNNMFSEKYSIKDILVLKEKQNNKCIYCFKSIKKIFHIDHYIPLSKGGADNLNNIQILCPKCNLTKHAKDPIQFANENGRLL